MSNELLFITGATGFIGCATAIKALEAGYRLRICLRKPSPRLESVLSDYSGKFEFVIVPDLTDDTAFDGKLTGVDYVLHIASPLPQEGDKELFFIPAVKATTSLLKAATKVPTIKKVAVTSSIVALTPISGVPPGGVIKEDNDWDFSVDQTESFEVPGDPALTAFRRYWASKLAADSATWEFRKTAKPHYSLVSLHPGYVYGHNPLLNADGSNTWSNTILWDLIMKGSVSSPGCLSAVHIQDVVDAHIRALDPSITDGSKYLLVGPKMTCAEITDIAKRFHPNSKAQITEDVQPVLFQYDSSKAKRELGIQWRCAEEMVREVMDQQLGVV